MAQYHIYLSGGGWCRPLPSLIWLQILIACQSKDYSYVYVNLVECVSFVHVHIYIYTKLPSCSCILTVNTCTIYTSWVVSDCYNYIASYLFFLLLLYSIYIAT